MNKVQNILKPVQWQSTVQSRTRLAASLGEREMGCHGNIPQSGRTWEHGTGGVPRVPMQGAGVSNTTGLKDPVHNYNLGFLSKGQKGIILSTSGLGKKSIALPEARAAPAKMGFGTGFGCVSSLYQLVTGVSSAFTTPCGAGTRWPFVWVTRLILLWSQAQSLPS